MIIHGVIPFSAFGMRLNLKENDASLCTHSRAYAFIHSKYPICKTNNLGSMAFDANLPVGKSACLGRQYTGKLPHRRLDIRKWFAGQFGDCNCPDTRRLFVDWNLQWPCQI